MESIFAIISATAAILFIIMINALFARFIRFIIDKIFDFISFLLRRNHSED